MTQYPDIEDLIPHSGRMVLIDEMLDWHEEGGRYRFQVRDGNPFVNEGVLATPMSIEHMAQSVAACLGYRAYRGGKGVRVGMIIGCKSFKVHQPELHAGDDVHIEVTRIRGNESLSHFTCEMTRSGEDVANATLLLYHAEQPPSD